MPAGLNLPTNISLQTSVNAENSETKGESELVVAEKDASGFASVVNKISPETINIGKRLPEDGSAMAENQQISDQSDLLQEITESIAIPITGEIQLVTGKNQVSEESLLEFMNEQGLSRSEILAILSNAKISRVVEPKTEMGVFSTDDWVQTKVKVRSPVGDAVIETSEAEQMNASALVLKELLETQLKTQLGQIQPSCVVEIIASKAAIQQLTNGASQYEAVTEPVYDVFESINLSRSSGDSETFSQNHRDSSSLFAASARASTETAMTQSELKDFRSLLADHLRRAETIQQLTDRLGVFVAKQVTAQMSQGRWSIDLTLHPAELGSIKVDMEMTERGLEATFRASQGVTRDLLIESMPRLKQWFEEGGINVAYSGLSQDSGTNQSTSDEQTNETARSTNDMASTEESGEPVETNGVTGIDPGRLDIRV
ncbi:MAG: flagellar hook-length control protein FliK [Pseudomonadota bacterium]|nr:flagellar hook-length control protein FliK [Pseudomonadota bacterium]